MKVEGFNGSFLDNINLFLYTISADLTSFRGNTISLTEWIDYHIAWSDLFKKKCFPTIATEWTDRLLHLMILINL